MKVYVLTPIGKNLARSVDSPDNFAYQIIHFLDRVDSSTTEQIADYCGASVSATASILGQLRRKRIVSEVTETRP